MYGERRLKMPKDKFLEIMRKLDNGGELTEEEQQEVEKHKNQTWEIAPHIRNLLLRELLIGKNEYFFKAILGTYSLFKLVEPFPGLYPMFIDALHGVGNIMYEQIRNIK